MALFALFVSVTFSSLAAGVLLAMAFYLLSRFIEAFVLMTTVAGAGSFGAVLVWISWLVPNFGRYNQSSWLVYSDSGWSQILPLLGPVLTETGVIGALLLVAAMVGFYRREI